MIKNFRITSAMAGGRLDDALALLANISKGEARRIIDRGGCMYGGSMVRVASRSVKAGEMVTVGIMGRGEFRELALPPGAIVYQDADLIAVNKPPGVASQRTPYQLKGTLEYWISEEFARQGISEPVRVVHRLDRGTSGLMLFPKNRRFAAYLSELFRKGEICKRYIALVSGVPSVKEWSCDGSIGKIGSARWGVVADGRAALTEFSLLASAGDIALVNAFPRTGRTHQIRVHLSSQGFPIVGDMTYGGIEAQRLMLHCVGLEFAGCNGVQLNIKALPDNVFISLAGDSWVTSEF